MKMQNNSTFYELDLEQLAEVNGGTSTQWGVATSTALGMTLSAAMVAAPLVAGALAFGGIVSAGVAIYYALNDDPAKAGQ